MENTTKPISSVYAIRAVGTNRIKTGKRGSVIMELKFKHGQCPDSISQSETDEVTNQVFRAWWNRNDEQRRFLMGYQYGRGGTQGEPMLYLIDAAGQEVAFEIDQACELIAALQHITNTTDSSDKGLPSFLRPSQPDHTKNDDSNEQPANTGT